MVAAPPPSLSGLPHGLRATRRVRACRVRLRMIGQRVQVIVVARASGPGAYAFF